MNENRFVNTGLERAVIGRFLHYGKDLGLEISQSRPEWFVGERHADMVSAIQACGNKELSSLRLHAVEALIRNGYDRDVVAKQLASTLNAEGVKRDGIEADLSVLETLYNKRQVEARLQELHRKLEKPEDTGQLLALVEGQLANMHREVHDSASQVLDPLTLVNEWGEAITSGKDPLVQTKFDPWDSLYEGLAPSTVNLISARPGRGKSVFLLLLACAVARKRPAYFVSVEMDRWQTLARRAVQTQKFLGIGAPSAHPYWTYYRRKAPRNDKVVQKVMEQWGKERLYLSDSRRSSPRSIGAEIRRITHLAQEELGVVIIDYVNILEGAKGETYEKVTALSQQIHYLARDHKVPVVLAAQMSRMSTKEDRLPELHDLRDTGALEQDADTVTFLHPREGGNILAISRKNRHGPMKTVELVFDLENAWMTLAGEEGDF